MSCTFVVGAALKSCNAWQSFRREAPMAEQAEVLGDVDGRRLLDALKLRLAAQIAPPHWRRPLISMSEMVSAGHPLDEVVSRERLRLPRELSSLLSESLKLRDPGSMLVDALRIRAEARAGWRSLLGISVYPAVLFVFALIVGVAFSYCMQSMVSVEWIDEFGLSGFESLRASIDDQHHAIVGLAMVTLWTLIVLATIALAGPAWAWLAVVGGMLVIGKPLRWLSLREVLYRYRLFVTHGANRADLAEAVARSFEDSSQAIVCKSIAARVQQGMPIGKAMGRSLLTDGLCRPALLLIDGRGDNIELAFEETGRVLGRLAEQRCRALMTIVPVFGLAMVGTVLWGAIGAYLMALTPLITMISSLS